MAEVKAELEKTKQDLEKSEQARKDAEARREQAEKALEELKKNNTAGNEGTDTQTPGTTEPGTNQPGTGTQTPGTTEPGTSQPGTGTQTPGTSQPGASTKDPVVPAPKTPEYKYHEDKHRTNVNESYGFYLLHSGMLNIKDTDKHSLDDNDIYIRLKQAYEKLSRTENAARFLLEHYPETVKPVRKDLEALIEKSYRLRLIAKQRLEKFEASMANR